MESMEYFDRIEVLDDGGNKVDPEKLGLDVEYIEQNKTPGSYVDALFAEWWHTGSLSENAFEALVSGTFVTGVTVGGVRYGLGLSSDYVINR